MGQGPLWRIDGPPPQAPPYTLINAARVLEDVDGDGIQRALNGVTVNPFPVGPAGVWDPCATGSDRLKAEGAAVPLPVFGAMGVYLAVTCSTTGIMGAGISDAEAQDRFASRAMAALGAVEAAAVEREFLTGDLLLNPHLADGEGTFPWDDTSTSVVNGLALLENEIAKHGKGGGMIHMSPGLALAASALNLIFQSPDAKLRTINGTIVVPGFGYAEGASPAAHAASADSEEWVYATGPVELRRSEPELMPNTLSQALDRDNNVVTYRAERFYVVDWDTTVQAAVLIDRCETACGSPPS